MIKINSLDLRLQSQKSDHVNQAVGTDFCIGASGVSLPTSAPSGDGSGNASVLSVIFPKFVSDLKWIYII